VFHKGLTFTESLTVHFVIMCMCNFACKGHPRNDLYCVGRDVKPCSLAQLCYKMHLCMWWQCDLFCSTVVAVFCIYVLKSVFVSSLILQLTPTLCFVGIKKYIVGLIIRTSSDASTLEQEKVYLGKLNMILVQVRMLIDQMLSHIAAGKWKCLQHRCKKRFFYFCHVFMFLSVFCFFKNVHWKSCQEVWEALLKPQKRIHKS